MTKQLRLGLALAAALAFPSRTYAQPDVVEYYHLDALGMLSPELKGRVAPEAISAPARRHRWKAAPSQGHCGLSSGCGEA
jgi:hypothetical protein